MMMMMISKVKQSLFVKPIITLSVTSTVVSNPAKAGEEILENMLGSLNDASGTISSQ